MKLFVKSPLIFIFRLLKWSAIFAFVALIKILALKEYSGFLVLLSECAKWVCVSFPAIYSLSFLDVLVVLMKHKNKSLLPIAMTLIPLLCVVLLLQPFLYSQLQLLASLESSHLVSSNMDSFLLVSNFSEQSYTLSSFIKQVYFMLDDFRQAYFEGYLQYLFLSITYVFFLFSLSSFTVEARWNFFNFLMFFLAFRLFILLYSIMNSAEAELYIFWFSSNQLKGIPSYIIGIGASSLLYLYGIVLRSKKVF